MVMTSKIIEPIGGILNNEEILCIELDSLANKLSCFIQHGQTIKSHAFLCIEAHLFLEGFFSCSDTRGHDL